jgi:hypothetical protein
MPKFIVWYKKTIKARDLNSAIKAEKQAPLMFHSIVENEDQSEQELTPLIGFSIPTEDDYEDD